MKLKKTNPEQMELDMTPMIDMTFQLIAFFMIVINFSEAEQNQEIQLPQAELARPPEEPFEDQLTLQLAYDPASSQGSVILRGNRYAFSRNKNENGRLKEEIDRVVDRYSAERKALSDVTIIVRADGRAPTGLVQLLIEMVQDAKFDKFALRAKNEKIKLQTPS